MIKAIYVRNGESAAEYDINHIPNILATRPRLIWIDILIENNVLGAEEISLLSESFKFHELSIEDCLLPQYQPKIEEFENYIFAAVHGIRFKAKDLSDFENAVYELDLFIGKDFVVTVHTGELLAIEALFERAKLKPQVELKSLEYLLYTIFHKVVASFEFTMDKLGDRFDEIEDRVLENPSSELMPEILSLKKILLNLRKITEPQQGVYTYFIRGTGELLSKKYSAYFREIYFKFDRITQFISSHNQVIGSILEIYVSGVTLKLNEVMKFLTIIATVFLPALLIASYYGMNVSFPEHQVFGAGRVWYFAISIIIGATVAVYWYIKKKKWF